MFCSRAHFILTFPYVPSSVSMIFAGSVWRSGKSTAHQQEAIIAAPAMRSSSRWKSSQRRWLKRYPHTHTHAEIQPTVLVRDSQISHLRLSWPSKSTGANQEAEWLELINIAVIMCYWPSYCLVSLYQNGTWQQCEVDWADSVQCWQLYWCANVLSYRS